MSHARESHASAAPLAALESPIARTSLADAVYETLVEAIVRGQLRPGDDLSAVALAEQFRVSRTPVTEALQRLVHDGLVEQVMSHRPRVTRLGREDVIEIYHMRKHLESVAAELAATRLDDAAVQQMRGELGRLLKAEKDLQWTATAIAFDVRFHQQIAEAAGNRRLRDDIGRYRRLVRCFCRLTGSHANLQRAIREHQAIVVAFAERKPAAARKAMASHIERRLEAVLTELYSTEA